MSVHHTRFVAFVDSYNKENVTRLTGLSRKKIIKLDLGLLRETMIVTLMRVVDGFGSKWFEKLQFLIMLLDKEVLTFVIT